MPQTSPRPGLILVGQVSGAFGVRGEIRIKAFTDDPLGLLRYGALLREDGAAGLNLIGGRATGDALISRAKEVETREQAQALRGLRLYIERAALPEPDEDEFYLADLIGLRVVSPNGSDMGVVKSVMNFGAGDLLEIAPADGGTAWWAPFTKEVVPEVRLALGEIVVEPPAQDDG